MSPLTERPSCLPHLEKTDNPIPLFLTLRIKTCLVPGTWGRDVSGSLMPRFSLQLATHTRYTRVLQPKVPGQGWDKGELPYPSLRQHRVPKPDWYFLLEVEGYRSPEQSLAQARQINGSQRRGKGGCRRPSDGGRPTCETQLSQLSCKLS